MYDISIFRPTQWYWVADDGRAFSSARKAIVPADDADFLQWLKTPLLPTRWPTDDNGEQTMSALEEVLSPYGIIVGGLDELRRKLKSDVDAAAEAERLKYVTPGSGQAMTYQQKIDEARAFKAASSPKAKDYPVLSSEIGITAETLSDVADIVLAAFTQWQQIGAAIEAIRLGSKRDIDATDNEAAARAIVDAIVWPSARGQA